MLEYKCWLLYFCSLRTALLLCTYCKGQRKEPITVINLFANSQRLWDHRHNFLLLSVAVIKSLEQWGELGQITGMRVCRWQALSQTGGVGRDLSSPVGSLDVCLGSGGVAKVTQEAPKQLQLSGLQKARPTSLKHWRSPRHPVCWRGVL